MPDEAMRTICATRYVTPMREGGSLPGIVEADDLGLYVVKFRGAAQGLPVLVAELLCGELGRALDLPVPDIALVEFDPIFANAEPDRELQDLLRASGGLNLGIDYLPGSIAYQPARPRGVDSALASAIVWFDAYIMNVDRTAKNPNLLVWHNKLWMIDHGAALYVHHAWNAPSRVARSRFPLIKDHVLLPLAGEIADAAARLQPLVTTDLIDRLLGLVPDEWLTGGSAPFATADEHRAAYRQFLLERLDAAEEFTAEALAARAALQGGRP
jgi:hypothetical protein